MKNITVRRLDLQFAAGQVTQGDPTRHVDQAIGVINQVLQREPAGLAAQLIAHSDEIEINHA